MKKLLLSTLMFVAVAGGCAWAADNANDKPVVIRTGSQVGCRGVSNNGRYMTSGAQYSSIQLFDIETQELTTIRPTVDYTPMEPHGVTNDGRIIGIDEKHYPAIWSDGAWRQLTLPSGDFTEGAAFSCTPEGDRILGYLNGKNTIDQPYDVNPVLWILEDGEYEPYLMPVPENDIFGRPLQMVRPTRLMPDGKSWIGVVVDYTGRFFTNITYTENADGSWSWEHSFINECYNMDKYDELMAKEPQKADYVDREPGDAGYADQVDAFSAAHNAWALEFAQEFYTGKLINTSWYPSFDGRYLAVGCEKSNYVMSEDGQVVNESFTYPALFDRQTGTLEEFEGATDFEPSCVNNHGDMWSSDGYHIFFLMHGHTEPFNLTDYLQDTYDFDLYKALGSGFLYSKIYFTNGDSDRLFCIGYIFADDQTTSIGKELFVIDLPEPVKASLECLNLPNEAEGISIEGDAIVFASEAKNVNICDLSGRTVVTADNVTRTDISALASGIYVVSANINGVQASMKFAR